ncbi:hypothetical protein J2X37_003033 [Croceicoccus sp. BE223]|nr:hypothetical protein [Croceicoccus sp. BE223]
MKKLSVLIATALVMCQANTAAARNIVITNDDALSSNV